jgi:hypothetical protein
MIKNALSQSCLKNRKRNSYEGGQLLDFFTAPIM